MRLPGMNKGWPLLPVSRQRLNLIRIKETPFPGIEFPQANAGNPDAMKLQDVLSYFPDHAPDLTVFPFL